IMSDTYAARFRILAVEVSAREVVVATAEPFLTEWEKELAPILRLDIKRVVANPLDIQRYLAEFYSLARSVKRAAQSQSSAFSGSPSNFEQLVDMGRTGNIDANDQHVVHIVDWLLQYAFDQRASDIHLEPRRDHGEVRFRIDGVMHHVYQIPLAVMGAVISRLKGLGRMDIVEKRRPLDGRIKTRAPDGSEIELRLSTMPTAFGEKMVMRIFNPDVIVQSFKEMGFGEEDIALWSQMTSPPNGIILFTGPTGSGKTTTLYSTLRQLAVPEVNVCTIEDPIEMISPQFNQMQVQHNIGLDFASGVRTLMRQDPDIIMVGEIRDLETAEMAIQAALTGHLVLSTLHTNDAPSAISRLLDLGVPPYLINATLLGVLAQRLVRTLCPHCKEREALDSDTWETLVKPWKAAAPATANAPRGCLECRMTGYLGRIGLYEMLVMSPGLRKLVKPACDVAALREQAYKEGMKPLRISGAQKVAGGLTTIEEVIKVTPPPSGI
ncbi:MAG: GspE/PulE family protein, partial [Sulfuricella sp.]